MTTLDQSIKQAKELAERLKEHASTRPPYAIGELRLPKRIETNLHRYFMMLSTLSELTHKTLQKTQEVLKSFPLTHSCDKLISMVGDHCHDSFDALDMLGDIYDPNDQSRFSAAIAQARETRKRLKKKFDDLVDNYIGTVIHSVEHIMLPLKALLRGSVPYPPDTSGRKQYIDDQHLEYYKEWGKYY